MISHKHNFIFIHIPKCGGTSVELALLKNEGIQMKNYDQDDLNFLSENQKQKYRIGYNYKGTTTQHRKIDEYKHNNEKKYFTFTFIRNPWERFLSEYFYILKCRPKDQELRKKFPSFKHFVKGKHEKEMYDSHDIPQIDFVLDASKYKMINFIGRCEDMQTDFDYVCKKLNISQMKLPYRNPTKHKHYTEYYDDETRQIVAKKFSKDIEYFGYEFGK